MAVWDGGLGHPKSRTVDVPKHSVGAATPPRRAWDHERVVDVPKSRCVRNASTWGAPHVAGMTFAVKQNVTADPVGIGLLGAQTVMLDATALANLIEQPRLTGCLHGSVSSVNDRSVPAARVMLNQGVTEPQENYTTIMSFYNTPLSWQKSS